MTDAPALPPPTGSPGLDFEGLRARALDRLPRMAPAWTDYNAHDPGVTTLEQLCYALTEAAYRAEVDIADLLGSADGAIDLTAHGLFKPQRIAPAPAVTLLDYRRLLLDRLPMLGQAWVTPSPTGPRGLYDLRLYAPHAPDEAGYRRALKAAARRLMARHRGLCEDAERVIVLEPRRVSVHARIEVAAALGAETVVARLLFNLGAILAPEARRSTPPDGLSILDALDGPRLRNGWIAASELTPKPTQVGVPALVHAMITTPGVVDLSDVEVRLDGRPVRDAIAVGVDEVLRLDLGHAERPLSVVAHVHGRELDLDRGRVRLDLQRCWTDYRRPPPDPPGRRPTPPAGRRRPPQPYASVQQHFPAVYRLGDHAPPSDLDDAPSVQTLQMQGFLLPFDAELAEQAWRIDAFGDLASLAAETPASSLDARLATTPGASALLAAPNGPVETEPNAEQTREAVLDTMLALYARAPPRADPHRPAGTSIARRLSDLQSAGRRSGARCRGGDPLAPPAWRRLSAVERELGRAFGLKTAETPPLARVLETLKTLLVDRPDPWTRTSHPYADTVRERFRWLPACARIDPWRPPQRLFRHWRRLPEFVLAQPPDQIAVRYGWIGRPERGVVVVWSEVDGVCAVMGEFPHREAMAREVRAVDAILRRLEHEARRVYLVDHILLRAAVGEGSEPELAGFAVSATASLVVCDPAGAGEPGRLKAIADTARASTPAHVALDIHILTPRQLVVFEGLRAEWLAGLRDGAEGSGFAAARLARFLHARPGRLAP